MVKNPPDDMPRISAYLYYEDVGAAAQWLVEHCGFVERGQERMTDDDGTVRHTALEYADGVVMMGNPGPDYRGPARRGHRFSQLYVYVDDVDAHAARTKAGGAKIVSDLEDAFYGDRRYTLEDPEGFHWTFGQRVRDVPPESWKA